MEARGESLDDVCVDWVVEGVKVVRADEDSGESSVAGVEVEYRRERSC